LQFASAEPWGTATTPGLISCVTFALIFMKRLYYFLAEHDVRLAVGYALRENANTGLFEEGAGGQHNLF
jgi:hypothetical protein